MKHQSYQNVFSDVMARDAMYSSSKPISQQTQGVQPMLF